MRANGPQLREITSLVDAGVIEPVVDRVFPFASTTKSWRTSRRGAPKARSRSRFETKPRDEGHTARHAGAKQARHPRTPKRKAWR
ncbi:zinc-binding dehydrogenase [Lentzea atacamensis]|uniref:zinc-binding dehydrogenase n=1 Tax=Lentzea atacamensis TaxID=531938 RepID=UPI001F2D0C5F|nr:zinc-binding dehydrogenase [Lentzea atacamensis]